jgi:predicted amidohydrolase
MSLTIAAAQSASVPGDISRNVTRHLQFGALAAQHGAQLLIFPELSLIGYELKIARLHIVHRESPELDPLRQFAEQARMTMVAGAPLLAGNDELNIGALVFSPDGSVSTHTKVHVHESEEPYFARGRGGPLQRVGDAAVALAICADASHSQHAADAAGRGASIYAVGAMIDEPGYARKAPLLQRYASEHSMTVLLSNYSGATGGEASAGRSALWTEDGQLVAASAGTEESLVIGTKQNGRWEGIVLPLPPHP